MSPLICVHRRPTLTFIENYNKTHLRSAASASTLRPSFAAANQVVTLTCVINERVVYKLGRLVTGQFSSVNFHVLRTSLSGF